MTTSVWGAIFSGIWLFTKGHFIIQVIVTITEKQRAWITPANYLFGLARNRYCVCERFSTPRR
jgi:hypothetical protein